MEILPGPRSVFHVNGIPLLQWSARDVRLDQCPSCGPGTKGDPGVHYNEDRSFLRRLDCFIIILIVTIIMDTYIKERCTETTTAFDHLAHDK